MPVCTGTRALTQVNFTHELSDVTLDNDKNYIPTATNHPLFDLFTINFVISVFQIMVSSTHGGSAVSYHHIQKIMAHVCKLLKKADPKATIKVAYFLVYPEGESQHQWWMPVDWGKNAKTHDHCRDAFWISIPVLGISFPILRPAKLWLDIGFD